MSISIAAARRTTTEEMEELLPPILRTYGAVGVQDGHSMDTLDRVYFMGLVRDRDGKDVYRKIIRARWYLVFPYVLWCCWSIPECFFLQNVSSFVWIFLNY